VREPLLQAFPFPSTGKGATAPRCQACVFIYSSRGKWVFPPLTSVPAPGCWACPAPARASYSPVKDSLPPIFSAQGAPPSFQRVLTVLIAYYSVSLFFPGWRSVCPGGYAALAQACLWGYRGTAKLTWSASSQAVWAPATGGPGGPHRFSV
jgi:hypothetical protein